MKSKNEKFSRLFVLLLPMFILSACTLTLHEADFEKFLEGFNQKFIPLNNQIQLAEFNAALTGSEEDYQKATELNIELTQLFSNKRDFKKLQKFREQLVVNDPLLKRELVALYDQFLFHQADPTMMAEMVTASKKITQKFSVFRTQLNNKSFSDNQVEEMLKNTLSSEKLEQIWKASKQVGPAIADDMIALVKMRNKAAQSLDFDNYFEMRLQLSGQDLSKLENIYEEFNLLTEGIFNDLKEEMDERLSVIYSVPKEQLMPWHYQDRFFQNAPNIYNVDLDTFYRGKDLVAIVENYFAGIGLDMSDIVAHSDLTDKPGKTQTGFSTNIDREGDVRILANIGDDEYSMNTLLYESAFALNLKYIDGSLPYLLREPSHFFTADAIGTLFSQFSSNPEWLKEMVGVSDVEKDRIAMESKKYLLLSKVVFSRWAQVMYHFEKSMYKNPDQDLNMLWWTLVEKYQKLNKPKNWDNPDWATKNHIVTMPCTYHNYILGELFAAQLHSYIKTNIAKSDDCAVKCINNPEIGKYLIEKVFKPGKSMNWEELIINATGEDLNPDYFKNTCLNL